MASPDGSNPVFKRYACEKAAHHCEKTTMVT